MSEFLTNLDIEYIDDKYARLIRVLVYKSDLLDFVIRVPAGFITDFSSVPRVPIAYWFWGGRSHREAVLHDWLYCKNSVPVVSFNMANKVFLEAMESRGKPFYIRYPMYAGVCIGGWLYFHKRNWEDKRCHKHKVMDSVEELKK